MYLASSTWAKSLTKFNPKFKILNGFWVWSVSKEKTHQFDFFNWLLNLKTLVISNGSKTVRNMIQVVLKKFFSPQNYKQLSSGRPAITQSVTLLGLKSLLTMSYN